VIDQAAVNSAVGVKSRFARLKYQDAELRLER
jgi:hypothetical protein